MKSISFETTEFAKSGKPETLSLSPNEFSAPPADPAQESEVDIAKIIASFFVKYTKFISSLISWIYAVKDIDN